MDCMPSPHDPKSPGRTAPTHGTRSPGRTTLTRRSQSPTPRPHGRWSQTTSTHHRTRRMRASTMTMNLSPEQWSPTEPASEIAPSFWRLPMPIPGHTLGGVCAFLVRDRDGYVLIDSGMDIPSCIETLEEHLALLGVPLPAIHTIVATHCHPDHLGQAARLRARGGTRVWLHTLDAPLVHPAHPVGDADLDALVFWLARHGFPPEEAEEARDAVDAHLGSSFLL